MRALEKDDLPDFGPTGLLMRRRKLAERFTKVFPKIAYGDIRGYTHRMGAEQLDQFESAVNTLQLIAGTFDVSFDLTEENLDKVIAKIGEHRLDQAEVMNKRPSLRDTMPAKAEDGDQWGGKDRNFAGLFGINDAIHLLKTGRKVRRQIWPDGVHMFLHINSPDDLITAAHFVLVDKGDVLHFEIDGEMMLATDWEEFHAR